MSDVRAKFKVDSVKQFEQRGEVELSAVTTSSEENEGFWKYTPSGTIKMQIDNEEAMDCCKPGQEYFFDFTLAQAVGCDSFKGVRDTL